MGVRDSTLQGRVPTWQDLRSLNYVEQTLSEAMRLYPPVYLLVRHAVSEVEIGGYTIPAGSDVALWLYHTQRDPRWFPDPLRFDPERFSPEQRKTLPACAYLPFGAGTRVCIGKQFATVEAVLALAMITQRYCVMPHPKARVETELAVTLGPKHGLLLRIEPRAPR